MQRKPELILAVLVLLICQAVAAQVREPIHVGGNVQESKLIQRVEPVYPATARAARISGIVILQVTVSETGEVTDAKVIRGHPLLGDPAVIAVRQWRYSPTLLNGQPVPVIATVTVVFGGSIALVMNAEGILKEASSGLMGEPLRNKLKAGRGPVSIIPSPELSFTVMEQSLRALVAQVNVPDIEILGNYVFREGKLFYPAGTTGTTPPELALDFIQLKSIAQRELSNQPPLTPAPNQTPLVYRLFVSEVGTVLSIQQIRGPKLPVLEAELASVRVVTPGRRGAEAVPMVVPVEIVIE